MSDSILKTIPVLEASPEDDAPPEPQKPIALPRPRDLKAALQGEQSPAERGFTIMTMHRATSPVQRRAIVFGRGMAVVVRVPTSAWIRPVVALLQSHASFDKTISAGTSVKPRTTADDGLEGAVASILAGGGRVLGVSTDPQRSLPASLVAAADVVVTLATPDDAIVASVIAAVLDGRRPRQMPAGVAAGLDLADLVAAIRDGSTPARCVERLVAASVSKSIVDAAVEAAPLLKDLHGYGAAMGWCVDLVAELDAWRAGTGPFPEAPRVVVAGPPGTGKTTLVRSLAKTARLPLVATSVAQWFGDTPGHLDSVIKAVNLTFEHARAMSPCVVLLDEIDAIPNRATMSSRGRDWWLPVVTHILLTLDSAVSGATRGLVIVGATNHPEFLDAALVRPGRLERIIEVAPPVTAADRAAILRSHVQADLPADADLAMVGAVTDSATGADLMGIAREARRRARVASRPMTVDDLMNCAAPPDMRPTAIQRRFALHESGHAVVGQAVGLEVHLLTTMVRGATGGMCEFAPFGDHCVTLAEGRDHVAMLLAGLACEEVLLGERSTAAGGPFGSDLAKGTDLLRTLRTNHGLGRTLTYAPVPDHAPPWGVDPRVASDVEADLQACLERAKHIVIEHRAAVEALADALLERRILDGDAVRTILAAHPPNKPRVDRDPAVSTPDRTPPPTRRQLPPSR